MAKLRILHQLEWTGSSVSNRISHKKILRRDPLDFVQTAGKVTTEVGLALIYDFTEGNSAFKTEWQGHCVMLGALVGLAYAKRLADPSVTDRLSGAAKLPDPTLLGKILSLRKLRAYVPDMVAAHANNPYAGRAYDSLKKPLRTPISCGADGVMTHHANNWFSQGFKFAVSDTATELHQHFYQAESVRNPMAINCIQGDIKYLTANDGMLYSDELTATSAD